MKHFTVLIEWTASYDYGAPLDESGRTTDLYFTMRNLIQQYLPNGSIPVPEDNLPRLAIPEISLTPITSLFALGEPTLTNDSPLTMEDMGQDYGLILYQHKVTESLSGILLPGDRARDRVIAYVNGVKVGVIDSTYIYPQNLTISVESGDLLQLLVENLGRVDYFSPPSYTYNALLDPYKGIMTDVTINGTILSGWDMYSLPIDELPVASNSTIDERLPTYYSGNFLVNSTTDTDPRTLDTFINVPTGVKGVVWVNGFMLGRYWTVGPQQSMYLPGTVLVSGVNEMVILELEPLGNTTLTALGESERIWGNNPDPDYP